jgi:5-formyltetrahydrofolate cyclo-ligase
VTEPDDPVAPRATPTKPALRRSVLSRRDAIPPEVARAAGERLASSADLVVAPEGAIVAGYLPIRSEIDPRPLMRRLAARGLRLALPAVLADGLTMEFRLWRPGAPLEPADFGLEVPARGAPVVDPDVLLVPLAVFDGAGRRIGWGKGHYDRALARLEATGARPKIGLAFALQRVEAIPAEPHDRRLDLVLTEEGPIRPEGVSACG